MIISICGAEVQNICISTFECVTEPMKTNQGRVMVIKYTALEYSQVIEILKILLCTFPLSP